MEYTVLKVHIVSINKNILSSLEYTVLKTHGKHIYWARLLSGRQAKFSNVFYRLSRNLNENGDTNLNWVYFIRTILNECGFTYIWETENVNNKEWLKCVVKQRLVDQFVQNFKASNLPLSLRLKGSGCHYNSIYNNTGTK
jgi:hypothetical protein